MKGFDGASVEATPTIDSGLVSGGKSPLPLLPIMAILILGIAAWGYRDKIKGFWQKHFEKQESK